MDSWSWRLEKWGMLSVHRPALSVGFLNPFVHSSELAPSTAHMVANRTLNLFILERTAENRRFLQSQTQTDTVINLDLNTEN